MPEEEQSIYTHEEVARGEHISGWYLSSPESYIGLAIAIWECHTDGSPALRNLWHKWSIERTMSTKRASAAVHSLVDALHSRIEGCCADPDDDGEDPTLPYCRRCASLSVACSAAIAILCMLEKDTTREEVARFVHFAKELHIHYEGARDGFGKPGRYARRGAALMPPTGTA